MDAIRNQRLETADEELRDKRAAPAADAAEPTHAAAQGAVEPPPAIHGSLSSPPGRSRPPRASPARGGRVVPLPPVLTPGLAGDCRARPAD